MIFRYFAPAALGLLLGVTTARAGDSASCASIANDQERLACFDASAKAAAAPASDQMSVSDILADFKSLHGKRVQASGLLLTMGQTAILYAERGSMTAVFVNVDKLPGDERRRMYKECGSGCDADVIGKVTTVMMNPGLNAESISLK